MGAQVLLRGFRHPGVPVAREGEQHQLLVDPEEIDQPGLSLVELVSTSFLRLTSVLIRLDLPTFDRPVKAISGRFPGGYWELWTALMTNSRRFDNHDL